MQDRAYLDKVVRRRIVRLILKLGAPRVPALRVVAEGDLLTEQVLRFDSFAGDADETSALAQMQGAGPVITSDVPVEDNRDVG